MASSVLDDIRIEFAQDELVLSYARVAEWLQRTCRFGAVVRAQTAANHRARLDRYVLAGKITVDEARRASERLDPPYERRNGNSTWRWSG